MNSIENLTNLHEPKSIVIADDHKFVCEMLCDMTRKLWPDSTVHQISDFSELLELSEKETIDLLIIDYLMPGGSGQDIIEMITSRQPDAKLIIFSGAMSVGDVTNAIQSGIDAYAPKSMGISSFKKIVELVVHGESYVPANIVTALLKGQDTSAAKKATAEIAALDLSHRELSLLNDLATGQSNKIIAAKNQLSESAVKQIIRSLFQKLKVKNRAEAVAVAIGMNIISPNSNAS